MGGWSIRAVSIAVAVILPLFAASVLLPTMAGMSTYVAASAGIALVAATMGLAAGCAAVILACCVAVLVEMAPVGEFHIDQTEDAVALALFATNGVTVAVIGSLLHRFRSARMPRPDEAAADQPGIGPEGRSQPSPLSARVRPLSLAAEPLSDREIEVLTLLSEGLTNAKIGASLFISTNTVKSHLKNVYGKLGVDSRTRAVTRGRELGVIADTWEPGFATMASIRDERAA